MIPADSFNTSSIERRSRRSMSSTKKRPGPWQSNYAHEWQRAVEQYVLAHRFIGPGKQQQTIEEIAEGVGLPGMWFSIGDFLMHEFPGVWAGAKREQWRRQDRRKTAPAP